MMFQNSNMIDYNLMESEAKFSTIFESVSDCLCFLDNKRIIVAINKRVEEVTGYSKKDLVGKNFVDIDMIPKNNLNKLIKNFESMMEKGDIVHPLEVEIYHKKGHKLLIETRGKAVKKNNEIIGVIIIYNDITEKKQTQKRLEYSELRYKDLYDNAPDGYYSHDKKGIITGVNKTLLNMLNYSYEEVIGKNITKFTDNETKKIINKNLEEVQKVGKINNLELNFIKKDGSHIPVLKNSVNIHSKDRKLIEIRSTIRDLTNVKKLEKQKERLSEKVIKLVKKIPLNDNEKLVFYGIVKYPDLNDQKLSDIIKIKRSTLTAIRNKLIKKGFYSTIAIPNFAKIGFELMCILNGKIPYKELENNARGIKKKDIINNTISSNMVVYDLRTGSDFLSIIITKNFIEAKKLIDYLLTVYDDSHFEVPNIVYYPFEMSRIIKLFDYSAVLKNLFKLNIKDEYNEEKGNIINKNIKNILTFNEKLVFYAVVKYPNITDIEIADMTKMSRITVSKIKNNLIRENFLKIAHIPDINRVNCELLVYSYAKTDKKIDQKGIDAFTKIQSNIFMINNGTEKSSICIFENFKEHKVKCEKCYCFLKEKMSIIGNSKRYLFLLNQIRSKKMDFSSLIKKKFELDVDF